MLHQLHTTLSSLLHARGQIPPGGVDVRFDIPSRQWVESLAWPALCCYLFDMAEVAEFRNAGAQVARANGRAVVKLAPRRVELRYLVCAFSSARADEQELIWRAMQVFLKHTTLPVELMPDALKQRLEALDMAIATKVGPYPEAPKPLELWGALELPPRPALLLSVTAPMELDLEFVEPLVLTRITRFTRPLPPDERADRGIDPARVTQRADFPQLPTPADGVTIDPRAPEPRFQVAGVVYNQAKKALAGVTVGVEGRAAEGEIDAQGREQTFVTNKKGRFVLLNLRRGDQLWIQHGSGPRRLLSLFVPSDSYDIELD